MQILRIREKWLSPFRGREEPNGPNFRFREWNIKVRMDDGCVIKFEMETGFKDYPEVTEVATVAAVQHKMSGEPDLLSKMRYEERYQNDRVRFLAREQEGTFILENVEVRA